jgi:hypothetical protein
MAVELVLRNTKDALPKNEVKLKTGFFLLLC